MKKLITGLAALLLCGCTTGMRQVDFVYFNLSANEIWVLDITGIRPNVAPGRLMPAHDENDRLEESSTTFFATVRVADRIKIVWKDGGKGGWPGGLKTGELVPPGVAHEAEFKRDDLGIPVKLSNGKLRFTYLGGSKWRVRFLQ